jgi:hypothetical protein
MIQYNFLRDFFGFEMEDRGPAVMRRFTPDGRHSARAVWELTP